MSRSGKKRTKRTQLEPLLPGEAAALNRAFYASQPAAYFERRVQLLLGLASKTDHDLRAHEVTHDFGAVKLTVPSSTDLPADERGHKDYVLIEAEMLTHHLAETLLTTFLAHRSRAEVPWIEISELKAPSKLKKEVERLILSTPSSGFDRDIGYVFLGTESPNLDTDSGERASFEKAVELIRGYLLHLGRVFLDRAPSYNAAKHGCVVQAGEPSVSLSISDGLSA
jgi:hypothetical protein